MYPASLLEKYPSGKWTWRRIHKLEDLERLINDPNMATVCELVFDHIALKDMTDWHPYISCSRCQVSPRRLLDNGKVISADRLRIACTDIDLRIILDQYDFNWVAILQVMECIKRPLPKWFIVTMRKWYVDKVQLKGDDSFSGKRRYMESKQRLNAIYGMCATAWARDKYDYDFIRQEWKTPECKTDLAGIQEQIDKMRKPGSKAFLRYDWGLYCTAYARSRLFRAASCCGLPLYCDTDSVKGLDWDYSALDAFNAELRAKSDEAGFTVQDPKGRDRPIGVFEPEPEYLRFSALHAKCYAGEIVGKTGEPELHATIAGVTADNGYVPGDPRRITKENELGSLEELQDGKKFVACGGTRAVYISGEHDIIVDGEAIHSYGGCAILNTTYEIGGTVDLVAMYGLSDPNNPYK